MAKDIIKDHIKKRATERKEEVIRFEFRRADIECMAGDAEITKECFKLLKEHLEGGFNEVIWDAVKAETGDFLSF